MLLLLIKKNIRMLNAPNYSAVIKQNRYADAHTVIMFLMMAIGTHHKANKVKKITPHLADPQ